MKHISWIEAARDLDCIRCRVAGRSGTMTRKFHQDPLNECAGCRVTLSRGVKFCPECGTKVSNVTPPVVVEFICEEPGCGDHRGPYIVDTEDSAAPPATPPVMPSAPVIPTPEEVAQYSKPDTTRPKSPLDVGGPNKEISQEDLIAFCKEKFPAKIEAGDTEFPLRVVATSILNDPSSPPIKGVKVCYGQAGPFRPKGHLQAEIRLDVIEEKLWCEDGEPSREKVEETLKSLEGAIRNAVRGVPSEIHKVVHRPTGPAERRICGECGAPEPCPCANKAKVTASQQGSSLAPGGAAPPALDSSLQRIYR